MVGSRSVLVVVVIRGRCPHPRLLSLSAGVGVVASVGVVTSVGVVASIYVVASVGVVVVVVAVRRRCH